jgi:tripeptide aminopeptidase
VAIKTLALAAILALTPVAAALADSRADATAQGVQRTLAGRRFKAAKAHIDAHFDRIVTETITLTEIPSPPFGEARRAQAFQALLAAEPSLRDVSRDAEGNITALRRGSGKSPLLVVAAHLDTVFPADTDVTVRRVGDELHAPGVGDDTVSLAVMLAFIRAMDAAHVRTKADILFVGDVGEEGPGNLRGMRHLFTKGPYAGKISAFISLEPGDEPEVTNGGVGSVRYHVTFNGPGGHSYGAFGLVNPAYAMGGAIDRIAAIKVPANPRTTFNVGLVGGGASVNSIPSSVWMDVDMRSEGAEALKALDGAVRAALTQAVSDENGARSTKRGAVSVETALIGERPVGLTDPDQPLVRMAVAAIEASTGRPAFLGKGSTDSNLPMSLGIPAVTFPSGFRSGRAHSPEEFIDISKEPAMAHMSAALTLILTAAGAR